jgi:hypothetical protein
VLGQETVSDKALKVFRAIRERILNLHITDSAPLFTQHFGHLF